MLRAFRFYCVMNPFAQIYSWFRTAPALLLAGTLFGCGSHGSFKAAEGAGGGTVITNPSFDLNIEATYFGLGEWNQYVKRDGAAVYSGTGTACAPTGSGADVTARACVHGGELRQVDLPSTISSCAGLNISDDLGAFQWTCAIRFGLARVFSLGLLPGKGLRDLIDPTTLNWRPNAVRVTGTLTASTASTIWWPGTPIANLPTNSGTGDAPAALTTAGTIYVTATDRGTRGYNLAADRVSIVTLGTSRLSYVGAATANCNTTTGAIASADVSTLICGGQHPYQWIEVAGTAGAVSLDQIVRLTTAHFSRLQGSTFDGASDILLGPMNALRVSNVRSQLAQFHLKQLSGGVLKDLRVAQGRLNLDGSSDNIVERTVVSGGVDGIWLNGAARNTLSRVTVFGAGNAGIRADASGADANVISFSTVVRPGGAGVALTTGSTNTVIHNLLGANAGTDGLVLGTTASISHAALVNHGAAGVHLTTGDQKFSGNLVVGTNGGGDCLIDGSLATPGLDSSCVGTDRSAGLLTSTLGQTSAAQFLGKILVDDPASGEDLNGGVADYPAVPTLFDFTTLLTFGSEVVSLFRVWGDDDGPYPATAAGARWAAPGRAGRIWDLSLASTANVLRDTSADGATTNAAIVNAAACPAWLAGSRVITDRANARTWLANAFERLDDGVGNDNGLCESNEVCVAAPNFGAYQGDGDTSTVRCSFTGGTVTGVIMYAHPTNGR